MGLTCRALLNAARHGSGAEGSPDVVPQQPKTLAGHAA